MSWQLSERQFLSPNEIKTLRSYLSSHAKSGGFRSQIRWMTVDLLLSSGLRCFEAANLLIDDCNVGYGQSSIFVRRGKAGKTATIIIDSKLKDHIKEYLKDRDSDSPYLLISERKKLFTRSGLQKMIKRVFSDLNFPEHYSIHTLRHTFCSSLYRQTKDLRLVQQQARHSSPNITMVYTNLLSEEVKDGMEGLYE